MINAPWQIAIHLFFLALSFPHHHFFSQPLCPTAHLYNHSISTATFCEPLCYSVGLIRRQYLIHFSPIAAYFNHFDHRAGSSFTLGLHKCMAYRFFNAVTSGSCIRLQTTNVISTVLMNWYHINTSNKYHPNSSRLMV